VARLGAGVDDFAAVPFFTESVDRRLNPQITPFTLML
jgi:hypothetical protein